MPKILDRCVKQVQSNQKKDKGSATAICTKSLQKSGNLKKGTQQATKKGKARGDMTPAQRAKDRAAKANGGVASQYKYNSKNNTAVKGRINRNVKRKM
jgi:hypothetical protein